MSTQNTTTKNLSDSKASSDSMAKQVPVETSRDVPPISNELAREAPLTPATSLRETTVLSPPHTATSVVAGPAPGPVRNAAPTPQPVRNHLPITFQPNAQMHFCSSCRTWLPRGHFTAEPCRSREVRGACEKCTVKYTAKAPERKAKREAKREADKVPDALKPVNKDSRVKKSKPVDTSITYGTVMPKNKDNHKADKFTNDKFRGQKSYSVDSTVTGMSLDYDKTLKTYSQSASTRKISAINTHVGNLSVQTPQNRVQIPDILLTEATAQPPTPPPPARVVKNPDAIIRSAFLFANVTPDILRYTPPTHDSKLELRLEDQITRFALATHLQLVEQYYRPQITDQRLDARKDFFKEVDQLLKLTEKRVLNPWWPLKVWLPVYKQRSRRVWGSKAIGKGHKLEACAICRNLLDELIVAARGELDSAEKQIRALCKEMGGVVEEKEIQRRLGQVKKGVADDCSMRGCLRLKEILTPQMLQDAKFSSKWQGDCKTRAIMLGDENMEEEKEEDKEQQQEEQEEDEAE
ncbi:hypothetical protein HBI26_228720 [Parastagonospora nodorum]|nr:hypothetical protein HBH52_110840 [Parastagonospora nodorum]KAH4199488.1 hypothetical protein HBI95_174010 [Parastagonospora nodorum]KAH5555266.1 hypothetical protein HBI26_228720 [Parastagonospora nodorum]